MNLKKDIRADWEVRMQIIQDSYETSGDLRRLVATQTPMKTITYSRCQNLARSITMRQNLALQNMLQKMRLIQ